MTINEAIKILAEFDRGNMPTLPEGLRDAVKLGIEALKAIKAYCRDLWEGGIFDLPGETKE